MAEAVAGRLRSVLLLKGRNTLVAAREERLMVNPTGNPGLATGGTGDVLTGVIASLIGQGVTPFEAAAAGAYVHGLAGDIAADRLGRVSLIAGDVLAALPEAVLHVMVGGRG
jgi:NAD(P)H-hydrate epimerase